ncbi:MAG: hypothetical protein WC845_03890 [Candidatus Staskawiczbacteria bacterium]|jgi:hypothetical protein
MFLKTNKKIILHTPKPFQRVGAKFEISGCVPLEWLGTNYDLSFELIDIDARVISVGGLNIKLEETLRCGKKIYFYANFGFTWANVSFVEKSQGRMTIKLTGQNEKKNFVFIPLIVNVVGSKEGVSSGIVRKHRRIEATIKKYKKDLAKFNKGIAKITKIREAEFIRNERLGLYATVVDEELLNGIFEIIETSEDIEMKKLAEKYKEALEWAGPICGGIVGRMDGFEFRIYSNDHDKHFHVIHKEKGINARFSFPDIMLVKYKGLGGRLGSKEIGRVNSFFKDKINFQKMEKEFQRRDESLIVK